MFTLAQFGQNASLLAQLLKAPDGALNGLVLSNSNTGHVEITPNPFGALKCHKILSKLRVKSSNSP